jgi:hypothetical protein
MGRFQEDGFFGSTRQREVREEGETITEHGDWTDCTALQMFRGDEACFCKWQTLNRRSSTEELGAGDGSGGGWRRRKKL